MEPMKPLKILGAKHPRATGNRDDSPSPYARTFIVIMACACLLSVAHPAAKAEAQLSGKTWTYSILAGLGLVGVFEQYLVALHKAKGSVAQGNMVMDAKTLGATSQTASPVTHPWSVRDIRNLLIQDVAIAAASASYKDNAQWRQKYEDFRGCWNANFAQPSVSPSGPANASSAGKSSATPSPPPGRSQHGVGRGSTGQGSTARPTTSPRHHGNAETPLRVASLTLIGLSIGETRTRSPRLPPSASPSQSPSPTPTQHANACAALASDYDKLPPGFEKRFPVDFVDLKVAQSDKSLYQQVLDQDVGSFLVTDAIRSLYFTYTGKKLAEDIAAVIPPTPTPNPVSSVVGLVAPGTGATQAGQALKDCYTNASTGGLAGALTCIQDVLAVQQTISATKSQRLACDFARFVYMPSFSAITLKYPGKTTVDTDNVQLRTSIAGSNILGARAIQYSHVPDSSPKRGQVSFEGSSTPAPATLTFWAETDPSTLFTRTTDFGASPGC